MKKIIILTMVALLTATAGCEWLKKITGQEEEEENHPPNTPSNPSPSDGATGQPITVDLSWTGGDPDPGDTVTYDVYFEANDSSPDVLVSNDQSGTTYDPGTLSYDTHYYWQIIATDNHGSSTKGSVKGSVNWKIVPLENRGSSTTGPVWDFTTSGLSKYTDNGDGTITDNETGLMWVKDGNSAGCNNGNTLNWDDAMSFCENLSYAGYTDWRLPNIEELKSIRDLTTSNPAINTTYFPNSKSRYYWSSTTNVDATDSAWYVDLYFGYVYSRDKTHYAYVRPVRGSL